MIFRQSSVTKKILIIVSIVLFIFSSCDNRLLINPVDPESDQYIGTPSVDLDGDGVGQYEDVDEIVLVSPQDEEVVSQLPVVLSTNQFNPEKVNVYWIQAATGNDFSEINIVYENNGLTSNECAISTDNFVNNTQYYWRAKAYDGSKWSDNWSKVWSFTLNVDFTVPQNPSPSDGSTITDTTPQLDWGDVAGATGYHIQVNTNESFTGTVIADDDTLSSSSSEYTVTTVLSDNTTYYWRARTKNEDGVWVGWSSIWSFTIDIALPTTPSPSNGSTMIDTTPLLDWEDVTGSSGYHIEVNTDSDFAGTVIADVDLLTALQYPITEALSDNSTYYWHVKIKNEDGVWGDWSSTWSFAIDIAPPITPSPSNGSTIIDTTPLLDWEDVTGSSGYHIEVNTGSGFTGTVIADDDTLTASSSEYTITTTLSDNTTYYWHVKIKNEDGIWGDWSGTWSFTVDIIPVLSTAVISGITATTATSGGDIADNGASGIIARGVCWRTYSNPTIYDSLTVDGSGTGSYTSELTGLIPGNTYYVRSYATDGSGTEYGDQIQFETIYEIGSTGPAGGIVFYDKGYISDGWRYLEAAPNDQTDSYSDIEWGGYGTSTDTVKSIGTGESNTNTIVNLLQNNGGIPYAAKVCQDLEIEYNGVTYNDWFLPSLDELYLMRDNLLDLGLGGFQNHHYWSSTEDDEYTADLLYFSLGGNQPSYYKYRDSDEIRAARAF